MEKEEVYVSVNGKKEAEAYKNILKSLGQEIYSDSGFKFYSGYETQLGLHKNGTWWCSKGYEQTHKLITIQELIVMLSKEITENSILDGKVAIAINNEREFKLLMKHYESKGWKWASKQKPNEVSFNFTGEKASDAIIYSDYFSWWSKGCKIIPFKDFASEIGIEVPVFVMTSEDGVLLYVGDDSYVPQLDLGSYTRARLFKVKMSDKTDLNSKFFSTKEAAEQWIKEANRTKEIILFDNREVMVAVTKNGFDIRDHKYEWSGEELEKIYTAYKSLQ